MNETDWLLAGLAVLAGVGVYAVYEYEKGHSASPPSTPKTVTHTVTHTAPRTVTHTVTQRNTVTHTATQKQTVTHTVTPRSTVPTIPTLTLTVNGTQFRTNEAVTLTATASGNISGLGGLLQIVDLTTGQVKLSRAYGTTFTVQVTSSVQSTQTFEARFVKNGQVLAHSNTVAITWAPAPNGTNVGYPNAQGQSVGLAVYPYTQSGKVGLMMHLQPEPHGFTNPVYQYWWLPPGGSWQSSGAYQDLPNYYVNADLNGDWQFTVYARDASAPSGEDAQQRAYYEAKSNTITMTVSNAVNPTTYPHTASGSVTVTNAPSFTSEGSSITLIAQASGITNPVYQFWVETPSGTWSSNGAYTSSRSYTVHFNTPGTWHLLVYARPASAPSNENAEERAKYEVQSPTYTVQVS